jgi:hypothetical protein
MGRSPGGDRRRPRDAAEPQGVRDDMSDASIVIFTSHGVPALRNVLQGIRETVDRPHDVVVFCEDCPEQVATYLLRQYLRRRIAGYQIDSAGQHGHCGLDRAYHLVKGDYIVRVDDTTEFQPGWLDRAIAALEDDAGIGCLTLVQPPDYRRKRGRPPTINVKPQTCAGLDMSAFVTRRELVAQHQGERLEDDPGGACQFQAALLQQGLGFAYLPGLIRDVAATPSPHPAVTASQEADLPAHEGATGAMQRLEQAYDLGDDVLLTCMACGENVLEVLAARVIFCEAHQVAIGFWYELRCPECSEVHYKDDLQFGCPA